MSSRAWQMMFTVLAALYVALLLVATHLPPSKVPETHISDKIEHFGAYGLLAGSFSLVAFRRLRLPSWIRTSLLLLATVWSFGALDELTQPPFGRTCDIHDWYADACGSTVAVASMSCIARFIKRSAATAN